MRTCQLQTKQVRVDVVLVSEFEIANEDKMWGLRRRVVGRRAADLRLHEGVWVDMCAYMLGTCTGIISPKCYLCLLRPAQSVGCVFPPSFTLPVDYVD